MRNAWEAGEGDYWYLDKPMYRDYRLVLLLHAGVTQILLTTSALPQVCWLAVSAHPSLVRYLLIEAEGTTKKSISAASI